MNQNNLLNKTKIYSLLALSAITLLTAPVITMIPTEAAVLPGVETQADIKEWYFKIENGKLYKRLYNTTTANWETEWIYVCDYPG